MKGRHWPRLTALAAAWASAAVLVLPAPGAQAVAPEATAWWWFGGEGSTPRNPGFAAGSLFVAAHAEGAAGVSALRLAVPDDTVVRELILTVDRSSSPPKEAPIAVQACPTNSAWPAVEGGALSAAPRGDCSTGVSFGIVEGDKVRFGIGGLVRDSYLNIVLMPQETTTTATTPYNVPQPPSQFPPTNTWPSTIPHSQTATTEPTTAPFEVVFKKPDAASITVQTYPPSPDGGSEEEFANPFLDADFAASIGIDPAPALGFDPAAAAAVAPPTPPASGPSRRFRPSVPDGGFKPIVDDRARDPKMLMALVATGLVLIYLGLLGGSGPLRSLQRLPGPIGRVLPEMEGEQEAARGIGRFARPRNRPPLKL